MTQQNAFNQGLQDAATRHGVGIDIEAYQQARDRKAVAPYVEPAQHFPAQKQAAGDITALIVRLAPPVLALTALGSIVCVVVAMAAAAIGAGFAFITANAVWVGGGVVALVGVVLALVGRGAVSGGSGKSDTPPTPNYGGKYEYYQRQEQGYRKL